MLVLQRGMAGGKAPKFFIQAPQYADKAMLRKFVSYVGICVVLIRRGLFIRHQI